MIQENRQATLAGAPPGGEDRSFEKIANLYKSAPGMVGKAENVGLPVGSPALTLPCRMPMASQSRFPISSART